MATVYPKLRTDLLVKRQVMGGEVTYLVKIREPLQYLGFREREWTFVSMLDGQTSYEEIAERFNQGHPAEPVDVGELEDIVYALKKKGLVERTPAEQSLAILEKLLDERHKRAEQSLARDTFYMTLATVNPEKLYKRIYRRLRWIWTPEFVVATLLMFTAAASIIISHWTAVRAGMLQFWSFQGKTTSDIVLLFCILAVVVTIHESAHALTCMNFGGEVNELGFMLIYFMPAFYANVSDAYLFDKKWHKYWVTLAGGYSELILCSFAVFTWSIVQPDTFLHHLAYTTMVFAGISTIIFNYNPLMKLDGYYLLSDILEVTNLRDSSFKYLGYLLRSRLFRVAAEPSRGLTPRKKRIFLIYSLLATPYSFLVVTLFLLFLYRFLTKHFPEFGLFLFFYVVYLILRKRLRKLMNFSHFVYLDKRDLLKEKASVRRAAYAAGGALLLLLVFPFRHTVTGAVMLEPARQLPLRVEVSGFVAEVAHDQGGLVPAGALVMRLRNDELVTRRQQAQAEVDRLISEANRAMAAGDMATYQSSFREQQRAQQELAELQRQESKLVIRAPFSGQILTLHLEDLIGKHVEPGELLCDFGALDRMRARIRISEFDYRELAEGQRARLKVNSFAGETFTGQVAQRVLASPDTYNATGRATELVRTVYAAPGKQEGAAFAYFELLLEIPNPSGKLWPGMSGLAKVDAGRHSLAGRVFLFFRDLIRSKVWW